MTYETIAKHEDVKGNTEQEKALALAIHLEIEPDEDETAEDFLSQIVSTNYDPNTFEAEWGDYLVLTDEEANDAWDEDLENYIEECILPELQELYRPYFDNESWKRDARYDGRGHSLNRYDGNEDEETVNGTEYYIYRTN